MALRLWNRLVLGSGTTVTRTAPHCKSFQTPLCRSFSTAAANEASKRRGRPKKTAESPPMTSASCASQVSSDPMLSSKKTEILDLVGRRQPGWSMEQRFYVSPDVYEADMRHIWQKSWLQAGFTSQIPNAGDFFTYRVGKDQLLIVRGDDGNVRALFNSCRHRGSALCKGDTLHGHVHRFVCPYHQWSYGRDGSLLHAREMPADFDKASHGLHQAHVEVVEGMIFVCLSPEKPIFDFEPARELISPQLQPHGLEQTRIAHSVTYMVNANWKLVYENNRECYHCNKGHPEYIASNYDTTFIYMPQDNGTVLRDVDPDHPRRSEISSYMEAKTAHWEKLGLSCTADNNFPGQGWYRCSRQPMKEGWLTESMDGQPVGPLLGSLPERDMGSLRIHTLPNFWVHVSSDHAVSARLTPVSTTATEVKVDWLVHKDAVEGQDYTLDKLLPFWQKTSEQDWDLCEWNQKGVESSRYVPGRLSTRKEKGVEKFQEWYLKTLATQLKTQA